MSPIMRSSALRAKNLALIGSPGSGKGTYGGLLAAATGAEIVSAGDILRDHVRRDTAVGRAVQRCQALGRLADDVLVSDAVRSYLEKRSKDILDQGALFEGTNGKIGATSVGSDRRLGFIFDGFPRTKRQVEIMVTENGGWPGSIRAHFAVSIDVPDSVCATKMLGRRICAECGDSFNVNGVNEAGFRMPPTLPDPPCPCNRERNWLRREDDTEEIMLKRIADFHRVTNPVISWYESVGRLVRFIPYEGIDDLSLLKNHVEKFLDKEDLNAE